ncbi:MAG: ABC transporter permease [Thermoleophilaceae bacterium]|nr:ABC transporter permease [Thermoleophilaceae bacterium]
MRRMRFWIRWSLRDLRRRWLQVAALALVIAIGVAVFAGLGGMRQFREQSATKSFAALKFHDIRVTLADGDYARAGQIARAVEQSGVPVAAQEERLLVRTQIDAAPAGEDAVTPGLIVGVPVDGERGVDRVDALLGRGITAADEGSLVGVLDRSFAKFYGLPAAGTLKLAGGARLDYVGQGQSPQYFLITSDVGFGGESTLGVIYAPLAATQAYAQRPGQVNELVLRLTPGTDQIAARRKIEMAAASTLPGATVTAGQEEPVSTILFRDAKNDQRMFSFFGLLVLLGAAIATFNLVTRTVEAERREIGIGMALGLRGPALALRPTLLGVEIALIGSVFGIILSYAIAQGFASVIKQFLPMPVYVDPFTFNVFLRGAVVGLLLPVAATFWPVWRAVRVQPIEAIQVSSRSASGGAVGSAAHLHLPGRTIGQMPLRNSMRTPRRTLFSVAGLGAVLGALIALLGIVDSFGQTTAASRAEAGTGASERLNVYLTELKPTSGPAVASVVATRSVAASETRLELGAELSSIQSREGISGLISFADYTRSRWAPPLDDGRLPRGPREIVIAPKAAEDLHVDVGDSITVAVPGLSGRSVDARRLDLRVSGITGDPFRAFAFADASLASQLGYEGLVNALSVLPAEGVAKSTLQRRLAANPAVALARPVTADTDALDDTVSEFGGIIRVAALAVLVLAVLMAYNLTAISLDERRREYATMLAFGMPTRRTLVLAATENLIIGMLGTILGIGVGLLTIGWIVNSLFGETWPEIGIVAHVAPATIGVAFAFGVLTFALMPFVLARRLTRMDLPSTLRVVE